MDEYTIHGHMLPALGSLGGLEEEVSKDKDASPKTSKDAEETPATRCRWVFVVLYDT